MHVCMHTLYIKRTAFPSKGKKNPDFGAFFFLVQYASQADSARTYVSEHNLSTYQPKVVQITSFNRTVKMV